MTPTDDVLAQVRRALDEFDEQPLEVSARRIIRVANLLGETQTALRFSYEVKAFGGDRKANGADTRRLMADPSSWGTRTGPAELALQEFMNDRKASDDPSDDRSLTHGIGELEEMANDPEFVRSASTVAEGLRAVKIRQIVARTRQRAYVVLCSWERQLAYSSINESIFLGFQARVDKSLAEHAPDLVGQFTAVHRRLRDAAAGNPGATVTEEFSQALTTCRRIFKAVVDHVLPPEATPAPGGHVLNDAAYKNRLFEYLKRSVSSDSEREVIEAMCNGLFERFAGFDRLASKAVHASVAREMAELCSISTYILCGEIIRIYESQASGNA